MDAESGIRKQNDESTSYLDFQVQQWSNSLPTELKFDGTSEYQVTSSAETRSMLKILLRSQASQLRITLRNPDLLSVEKIAQNMEAAEVAVGLAQDTVQCIHSMH